MSSEPVVFIIGPLESRNSDRSYRFVNEMTGEIIISPAVSEAGYKPILSWDVVADDTERVMERTRELLTTADIVIFDLTNETTKATYELGFRDALNKPAIALVGSDTPAPSENTSVRYIQIDESNLGEAIKSAIKSFENNHVPAADRYVSVADNRSEFESLTETLERIRAEFANDHNKGELAVDNVYARLSDIDIFVSQVRSGFVSRLTAINLRETLTYLKSTAVDVAATAVAINLAISALKSIFGI